jgi:hypothetical protein
MNSNINNIPKQIPTRRIINNDDTLNKLNESFNYLKNNKYIEKTREVVGKIPYENILNYIKTNRGRFIFLLITIIALIIYFVSFYKRIEKSLNKAKYNLDKLAPLQSDTVIMNSDYRLCDFYIASSYKSYLPCTNWFDYASPEAIKNVIVNGARYVDLDVFNNDFKPCTEPVICAGDEIGNWHWTTSFHFAEAIDIIAKTAFGSEVKNPTDPFFININFYTWGNKDTINKCATIIKDKLNNRLLGPEFSYQGVPPLLDNRNKTVSSVNLATTKIKDLLEKVIIISSGDITDTDMDELTNLHADRVGNFRNLTYTQVKNTYDAKEITEYSRRNLTRVSPDFTGRLQENYNFYTPYYLGCQFLPMNYNNPGPMMDAYTEKFQLCSFVLKPFKLRYQPTVIEQPLAQNKSVSFEPKVQTTPFYSITY